MSAITAYLSALHGSRDGLIEVRYRCREGMSQRFIPTDAVNQAARLVERLGRSADVYVGVAARCRPSGRRAAVADVGVLWADCDTQEAAERLDAFEPAPSFIVRSGSLHGRHAYWLLADTVSCDLAESANRRLAAQLHSDSAATDAARILRPPSTWNFKYDPPGHVQLERLTHTRHQLSEIAPGAETSTAPVQPVCREHDSLLGIAPEVYVRALLGVDVPRNRKVRCPFHEDRTPSLHVYETPEGGWFCFGCRRGSSIYDMAAEVWGMGTRGPEFLELRQRLEEQFGVRSDRR